MKHLITIVGLVAFLCGQSLAAEKAGVLRANELPGVIRFELKSASK